MGEGAKSFGIRAQERDGAVEGICGGGCGGAAEGIGARVMREGSWRRRTGPREAVVWPSPSVLGTGREGVALGLVWPSFSLKL